MKKCIFCEKELTKSQVKFCSPNCKAKAHYKDYKTRNPNSSYSQFKRADERKISFIKEIGGKCSICGYKKNYSALHFHHVKEKTMTLDSRTISNSSLQRLKEELKKCIILCANCHAEHHNPQCSLEGRI